METELLSICNSENIKAYAVNTEAFVDKRLRFWHRECTVAIKPPKIGSAFGRRYEFQCCR